MEERQVNHSIEVGKGVFKLAMSFSPDAALRLMATSASTVDAHLRGPPILGQVTQVCCGHATAGSSLARTTRQFAVGTPIQVTPTGYAPSPLANGSILASASWDETVRFWNATTRNSFGQHLQHDEQVKVVRFSPSGEFVAHQQDGVEKYIYGKYLG
jgi:WD40 repeat protein